MYTTDSEKQSYAIGFDIGQSLKTQGLSLTLETFFAGFGDGYDKKGPRISPEELHTALEQLQQIMQAKDEENLASQSEENKIQGARFLAENAKKAGIKVLPSGLQYREIQSGNGTSPQFRDEVTTHYHGTLVDGSVFDSSYERGEPVRFPVGGVIKGWTEALQLMREGSIWEVFLPPELAYGPRGAGEAIGPNATLIFKVELIKVHK